MSKIVFLKKDIWVLPFVFLFLLIYVAIYYSALINEYQNIRYFEYAISLQFLFYITFSLIYQGINNFFSKSFNNFFIMLSLFHIGLPIAHSFGYSNIYFDRVFQWYSQDIRTYNALISVVLFLNIYMISNLVTFKSKLEPFSIRNKFFININFYTLMLTSLTWVVTIYLILDIEDYGDFYTNDNLLFSIVFTYITVIINISFLIALLAKYKVKLSIAIFILWSLFAFNMGVRGPALYPYALGIGIIINRGYFVLNFKRLIIGAIAFLSAISYKFAERNTLDTTNNIDPLAAIQEMGGSLRPLYEVNKWIEEGISYYYGATYIAPIDRQLTNILKYSEPVPSYLDDRLMNVVIMDKAGPYGFSIIAEAFINFSNYGVVILGVLSGLYFKYFDSKVQSSSVSPVLLIIGYGFFYHIRQAFISTFLIVYLGLLYLLIVYLTSSLFSKFNR